MTSPTSSVHASAEITTITRGEAPLHTHVLSAMLFGDTVDGTPTVEQTAGEGLTFGTVAVNAAELDVEGKPAAIGEAVQFRIDARGEDVEAGPATLRVTFEMTEAGGPRTSDIRLNLVD